MNIFVLYRNEHDRVFLQSLLVRLACEHGTKLPGDVENSSWLVLQWGEQDDQSSIQTSGSVMHEWLNPNIALSKLRKQTIMDSMLTSHGITWRPAIRSGRINDAVTQLKPYRLFIFNLRPVALYQGVAKLKIDERQRSQRQLIREAVRAVYVLGLDFAEVALQPDRNRWAVTNIDPTPFLSDYVSQAWSQMLTVYVEEVKRSIDYDEQTLRLGSDSEFILRRQQDGKVVMADRYFSKKGVVGCDGLRLTGKKIIYPFVELRPKPVIQPHDAIREIRHSMIIAMHKIGERPYEWVAGGMPVKGLGSGGHLHFSGIPLRSQLLRVLDNYLALPIMMIETKKDGLRRPKFGTLGDFRVKGYGGFEYRTLPSWLVSARITLAIFALARYLLLYHRQHKQRPLADPVLLAAFYHQNKEQLLPSVRSIWTELLRTNEFIPFRQDVKPLMTQSLAMQAWQQDRDFRASWNI